ncbi:SGNH/GDSL hydrolase family protein [Pedosphaera parvula]|uniref:Lipolytic protein G-D-S-L family n=1 Tax=Pedosphaera parvula (strain Ellin514) TaxID=320771 RepID=B9XCK8_PEDPL|nr:SGNH/GDSL hydrolase family protein [Pedosphaera parvula]EEF62676.1 lipolytic protein G-D-S-L family [Pedosphaera parvula Ellin514]
MRLKSLFLLLTTLSTAHISAGADFALQDGDTLVFLGDSITAGHGYTKLVEEYTLLRFPDRHVRFFNAGQGGDTAAGGLQRLDRDVFSHGATVLTVAFGVNDIGWGMKADEEHKQKYFGGIRGIIEACQKHHVRVFICSPAITAENPDTAENGFLQKMTDEGLAIAKSMGAQTIDIQRTMRSIQREITKADKAETDPKKKTHLHVEDGVHLTDLGQLAMGYAILKGLGAPSDVSSVALDGKTGKLISARGCRVDDVHTSTNGVTFTRVDEGLPLNLGMLGALNFRFIPIPNELNRYLLTIQNLPSGKYNISVDGRTIGIATDTQLATSLNISSMTTNGWEPGGPWDAQAAVIKELTEARSKMEIASNLRVHFLTNHPQMTSLISQAQITETNLVCLQRQTAHPFPYHFEIRKAE